MAAPTAKEPCKEPNEGEVYNPNKFYCYSLEKCEGNTIWNGGKWDCVTKLDEAKKYLNSDTGVGKLVVLALSVIYDVEREINGTLSNVINNAVAGEGLVSLNVESTKELIATMKQYSSKARPGDALANVQAGQAIIVISEAVPPLVDPLLTKIADMINVVENSNIDNPSKATLFEFIVNILEILRYSIDIVKVLIKTDNPMKGKLEAFEKNIDESIDKSKKAIKNARST